MSQPLVESVRRNQAPEGFQRIAKCGFRARSFRSRVNRLCGDRGIPGPRRDEPPSHQREFPDGLLRILANDWYRLGRGEGSSRVRRKRSQNIPRQAASAATAGSART